MSAFVLPNASFAGKVALVTGGSAGIGRATARAFAAAGASVVLADLDEAGGKAVAQELRDAGQTAVFMQADISQAAEVSRLIADTVATFGRLDCAHNNAGILGGVARVADVAEDEFDRLMSVNLKGVWLCLKEEILQMQRQGGGGTIVNTASIAGIRGSAWLPIYSTTKHGVVGLTRAAALGYAEEGIRVNAICPGYVDTQMVNNTPLLQQRAAERTPMGRLAAPEEIAAAVVWLCSDAAAYMTGETMVLDGGVTA
ncbi:MAG: glucose 1-dehydrogenase [Chloroflexia bacterium]|mgnify:CR=1 FL=1|nr:glucose 1-dehydrogenase [Chloroflexia bacterium]